MVNFKYAALHSDLMVESYSNVKGTEDYYPEQKFVQQHIFSNLREVAQSYNFKEVETPVFEYLDLLTKKEGEEIINQIFVLEKRSKEKLGLRFDLTVPGARLFITKQKQLPKPVKWFSIDKMWRYEQPQAGRLREFYQFNCEIYGSRSIISDAQLISLAITALEKLGLRLNKDFKVYVNNRKLLEGFLQGLTGKKEVFDIIHLIDKREKISEDEFVEGLEKFGIRQVNELIKFISLDDLSDVDETSLNEKAQEGLNSLRKIFSLLDGKIVFAPGIARGLSYYTDLVFEIFDADRKLRALAGGGRYDLLIEQFGGLPTPATGFAMGYSTLSLLLKQRNLLPSYKNMLKAYVAPVNDSARQRAFEICSELQKNIIADTDLMNRSLSKQLKYASSLNAEYVVFVGEDELSRGMVKVRDMQSGKEEDVRLAELSSYFQSKQ